MKKARRLEYLDQLERVLNNEIKREVYKREGLLAAIDSVHIARSVQVDPDSSLLNVVSGDAGIAVGSIFDVSVLEKSK